MTTVLVTGPMGSGKSLACRHIAGCGWPVYDCDSRCKALYRVVPGLKQEIETALGIPFCELGRIFDDPALKARLEAIVYPLMAQDIRRWKDSLQGPLAFVESATALGRPEFDGLWDKVLLISAPPALRASRSPQSGKRSRLQRFPRSLVDRTIRNSGTPEALYTKIDNYLNTLI